MRQAHDDWCKANYRAQAEKVNSLGGPGIQIAIVFGRILIILLSQLQPLLILSLVTRPVCSGGPSPFQG
jgi:hypothetical protein